MEHTPPAEPAVDPAEALSAQAKVGKAVLRKHGLRLALVLACVALPLWGFGELAEDVAAGHPFFFDVPVLEWLHSISGPGLNRLFLALSAVGFSGGVVPADVVLVVALALRRHPRSATFAAVSIAGSALINVLVKHVFARARPALWLSLAPETTYSFPSGHAMGSATLACVLACLAWRTRWRWPVVIVGALFTVGVGLSRAYLGVHYPSDVLAGWAAAVAWVLGVRFIAFHRGLMTGTTQV
ncbi:phosphatase PAP2 family protein [Cognatilysobacter lacus]|uniref:undecaprenyl-diphosphate phosphatase n=1 Tax=Cognatilysobacter lacus TaxID=1643323 RepID=A0A5D8Z2C2_9GAMM|nr:phosphatase PAP2 family protein [Lysobacter lacus]TZF89155.1 phosphatase PAP2 family protein [Lysobacter lacus]